MKHPGSLHKTACFIILIVCFAVTAGAQKKDTDSKNGFRILGGLSANSYKVSGQNPNFAPTGTTFKTSFSPVIAIGYYSDMGFEYNKFFFYPQLKFSSFKNSGSQEVYLTNGALYQNVKTTEKASAVISTLLDFGYNLTESKNFRLEIYSGFAFILFPGNKQVKEGKDAGTGIVTTTEENGRSATFNFNGGLNAIIKNKFIIWTNAGTPTATTDFNQYKGKLTSVQGGIGYLF
jgi:hypothetical protein